MTNQELAEKRAQLGGKVELVASLHPMQAMGQLKAAAMIAAEITDELARRELARGERHE